MNNSIESKLVAIVVAATMTIVAMGNDDSSTRREPLKIDFMSCVKLEEVPLCRSPVFFALDGVRKILFLKFLIAAI